MVQMYASMNKEQLVSVACLLLKQNEEREKQNEETEKRNEEIMGEFNSIAKRTPDLIESIMELNATIKTQEKS